MEMRVERFFKLVGILFVKLFLEKLSLFNLMRLLRDCGMFLESWFLVRFKFCKFCNWLILFGIGFINLL